MMLGLPLLALQLNLIHVSDTINTAAAGANNEIVVITVCLLGILGIVGSFDIALGPVTWVYTAEAFDYMSRTQGSSYAVISVVGSYHLLKFCNCWRSILQHWIASSDQLGVFRSILHHLEVMKTWQGSSFRCEPERYIYVDKSWEHSP
ncbi:hypothetical protein LINPERPRIM_LOCUS1258 [Linum perenne]